MSTSEIRWGRVIAAAVLSEAAITLLIVAIIGAHRYVFAPGQSQAVYDAFADHAAYYTAPAAAGVFAFLFALWAGRPLTGAFVLNGILVGAVGVILTFGFYFAAAPDDRPMYLVSFVLRLVGGYAGGKTAERAYGGRHGPLKTA